MTERWFRWYDGTVRDGKMILAAKLCEESVCTVVGVWAALLEDAATSSPRGTATRGIEYHSLFLGLADHIIGTVWNALERVGAVKNIDGGIVILSWSKRQFETDAKDPTAKERKTKWKQAHNKDGTARNAQERSGTPETETETETDKNIRAVTPPDDRFEEFWASYPKRDGANPQAPAHKKFRQVVKSGVDPGAIVAGAKAYASAESKNIGTPYIAQAVTWLNQRRWEDYQSTAPPRDPEASEALARAKGWHWNGEKYVKIEDAA